VNTIVNKDGKLAGYNTYIYGAINSLKSAGVQLRNKKALVLGAGGAAKAVVAGLAKESAKITIANRTLARAEAIADAVPSSNGFSIIEPGEIVGVIDDISLVINCTPVGMHSSKAKKTMPLDAKFLRGDMTIFDLIYNPLKTSLIKAAEKKGAKTISGLDMLVEQGAASFKLWTGKTAPKEIMKKEALAFLRK
jgi:shikimate dehydrogenase